MTVPTEPESDPTTVAFVCVENAGRSQMAAAFARRERERRSLGNRLAVLTGGTRPADAVHDVVVDAMAEVGVDLSARTPTEIEADDLRAADVVVTMGCSATDVCPATWHGETRDWDLRDPAGEDPEAVRAIRDEIERRVAALFDELTDGSWG